MRPIYLLLFILIFASCGENKKSIPSGILDENKMSAVITDVQIADAAVEASALRTDSGKIKEATLFLAALSKNNITPEMFSNSWTYYLHHPEKLDAVYQQVINQLSMLQLQNRKTKPNQTDGKTKPPKSLLPFAQKVFSDSTH